MLNITLCCSAAMSTSLLVNKMMEEAQRQGIQMNVWAKAVREIEEETKDVDVILIAPQVKYAKKQIEKMVSPIPVIEISIKDYGLMNGKNIFNNILNILHQ
ncbi:PTS sugar transporter subunit IIB [Candidatus Stoquefichus sp. SB1]|uniref:PTS sugar transporter subunit IIB n=1 Tax=Candidatus Stoquefichus sp. SB1 TaxID=1658109 RepID=UPI00067F4D9D|nr:PTS sugar transporter subunit IIB [Candidatus Stoquefichus sp. SB1]